MKKSKPRFVLRGMRTKVVRKILCPGTWIRIWWSDAEPTTALVLHKPRKPEKKGDAMHIPCFYPNNGRVVNDHALHTQVLEICTEPLVVPGDDRAVLLMLARAIEKRCLKDPLSPRYGESRPMQHGRELLGQALQYVC